ncbi:glucose-6-phosphate isomerase [Methanococcus maripaludis C5]|uniref:Probable glucose-6-phosphate isomerase n=1 Tax=Methanococcus maripaludis (strain C5 / ATCC BAA-1333) TaxID=402880 RepID=A4FWN9_METM5|nr:glucose-6-phosphate isomerase [Methanococcus maripaludis]ABO34614.1 glucose-6-phosphate isomerase [Methanococcus maripaludis C5]
MDGELSFKYDNVMEETLGTFGISVNELEYFKNESSKTIEILKEKEINGNLGFLDVLTDNLDRYHELKEHSQNFENMLIIGIGGSNLGLRATEAGILGNFSSRYEIPRIFYMDNSDPEKTHDILSNIDLEKTLVFVISKSGNTVETLANFFIIRNLMKKKNIDLGKHVVSITSGGELKKITEKENYIHFEVPENVGGRFSVLSSVGIAPLSCTSVDIEKLIEGAKSMEKACKKEDVFKNPALINAVIHKIMYNRGKTVSVMMPYIERLRSFGMWYGQLWAESLGKKGFGQTPVIAVGATSQHSQLQLYMDGPKDKIATFLKVNKYKNDLKIEYEYEHHLSGHNLSEIIGSELVGTENSMTHNNVPNVKISLSKLNEITMGKLFLMYEMQTAISGELYGINAFDQPAVEYGKKIAHECLTGSNVNSENKSLTGKYTITSK